MACLSSHLGWRTSWLSREAIAFGGYLVMASVTCVGMLMASHSSFRMISAMAILTALVGWVAVGCSAMIYIATQRSLWNAWRTGTEFFAASLGLGMATVAVLYPFPHASHWLLIAIGLGGLVGLPRLLDHLRFQKLVAHHEPTWNDFSYRSGRLLGGPLQSVWRGAWLIWFASLAITGWATMIQPLPESMNMISWIVVSLLFASQFLQRWLYFAAIVHARMPGASR